MIDSSPYAAFFLYSAIVLATLLLKLNRLQILGFFLLGTSLLLFEFPDLPEYKAHYELAGRIGFERVWYLYNFEPGYVALVAILSKIISFEAFYVISIMAALFSYTKFFRSGMGDQFDLCLALFLSICLYFISFTIRTTIASIFLALAIVEIRRQRNLSAVLLILFGSGFHLVVLPLIVLPVVNRFSVFFMRWYPVLFVVSIVAAFVASEFFSLDSLLGIDESVDFKITAYQDIYTSSNSIFFALWLIVSGLSLILKRQFDDVDRVVIITSLSAILFLYPYPFFQGRFMWLTSFIFSYIFAKVVFGRIKLSDTLRICVIVTLPLAALARF